MNIIKLLSFLFLFSSAFSYAFLSINQLRDMYKAIEEGNSVVVGKYVSSLTFQEKEIFTEFAQRILLQRNIDYSEKDLGKIERMVKLIKGMFLLGIDVVPYFGVCICMQGGGILWPLADWCASLTYKLARQSKENIREGLWRNYDRKLAYQKAAAVMHLFSPKQLDNNRKLTR